MTQHNAIKLLKPRKFVLFGMTKKKNGTLSIVDVVAVPTDSPNPRGYWSVLKNTFKKKEWVDYKL